MTNPRAVWMDGRLVPWAKAQVHVMSHSLHYGSGVFEGIRCYDTPKGPQIFRLHDHVDRLHRSARCMLMPPPYGEKETVRAIGEAARANRYKACFVN